MPTASSAARAVALAVVLLAGAAPGCRSGIRRPVLPDELVARPDATPTLPELGPTLALYPLEDRGTRSDLLAFDEVRSLHLVQTDRPLPSQYHEKHLERVYVLTGSGTTYVDGRSYPARPGSALVIQKGVVHSAHPDPGETLVALVWFEPPMTRGVDRVIVDTGAEPAGR